MKDDKDLSPSDVQTLSSREGVGAFFAGLGYKTDARLPQTAAAMGITAASLQRELKHIERVAVQGDGAEPLDVYLVELTSVTVAATQGLARALRNRAGNYLLVLTDDFERLDFVLLERALPVSPTTPMATRQVSVRPRILTVNRRNPTAVQLRVLRRFTYTESDSDAQYDKLLSAYSVAEWSEPLFNNRALFSDYYLNERLPGSNEWQERPETAYHRLRDLLSAARQRLSGQPTEVTRGELLEPTLEVLGFRAIPAGPATDDARPHYFLHALEGPDKPVAVCLAYAWNRNLDGRDETRDTETSNENPGARVVALLDSGQAPWAIVTNGKLWRLYSTRAHSRATNYYEIDLDETLALSDPNVAFRYFWLFFRAAAFVPRDVVRDGQARSLSFLDELVEESESYAKGLGERLKERVFEEIFPHFAEGFIEHLRAQPSLTGAEQGVLLPVAQQLSLKQEPGEEFRRQVFQGTLTCLYRLLFLLYAESRALLPVKEVRGYWEHSLTRMKEEIAARAGDILDEGPAKLRKSFSADSTTLYDRLLELFAVVDRGSRDLNVPLYNGGLFITSPEANDHSTEAESARFLLAHKIPDRYLALGLDRLARDLDQRRQSLVFIDYKSMGVRQLGSIYEGLLEFKVRIAPEKMAVVQGKKTEEVIPYDEAVKTIRKVLTKGRGRTAEERIYRPGDVYLENDRRERKASGSYYTPDHIVKYIVEHTLGPVLEEKFEKLRPRFRKAQQAYRDAVRRAEAFVKQGMKPDDPAKVANTYRHLVDELFDLRVLDPAMGSGHFLVEAVDLVCDQIIGQRDGFLQAFPWNPVTAYLDETRRVILTEMERQGVSIDAARLTDINLLKRHVLKRCVYGVDLNPMAVELAKVSLWLDCFTLGAPLSFLDHHLKCGNSLIGTTVQEVEAELAAQKKGHVGDLFGGPFQGLLSATAMIEELERNPDATVEQAERSHSLFAEFEKSQAPYKRALDIWVSRYFGNTRAKEYLTLVGRDYVEEIRSSGKGLSPEYREVINKGAELGDEKQFFHWDLEFPEAFVDLEGKTWKPRGEQGFDAVIGNPPYDVLASEELGHDVSQELDYFKNATTYEPAIRGKTNLYKLFICRAHSLARGGGYFSFIVPMSLLGDSQSLGVRRLILENASLRSVEAFPQKDDSRRRVFPEAKLATCVFVSVNEVSSGSFRVRSHLGARLDADAEFLEADRRQVELFDSSNLTICTCPGRDWELVVHILSSDNAKRLGHVVKFFQGEINETNEKAKGTINTDGIGLRLVRGANVTLYAVRDASQGHDLYVEPNKFLNDKEPGSKAYHHNLRRVAYQGNAPQNNFRRIIAAPVTDGEFCAYTVNYCTEASSDLPLELVVAFLNSKMLEWYFRLGSSNAHENEYQMNALPIPSIATDLAPVDWRSHFEVGNWATLAEVLYEACGTPGVMPTSVSNAISAMSRRIQAIEAKRVLKNRSERSRLAPESQPIQDAIDAVLFRCYGLSDDDAHYVKRRLEEML